MQVVTSIIRYIKGTPHLNILYKQGAKSTFASCNDNHWKGLDEKQSNGSFVFILGFTPIIQNSKKQTCVALSSIESEYHALMEATKEGTQINNLFKDLDFFKKGPIELYCDNKSSIKISKNLVYYAKLKHSEIHRNYMRDIVMKKKIEILYNSTEK